MGAGALRRADLGPTVRASTCLCTETETSKPGTGDAIPLGAKLQGCRRQTQNLRGLQTSLM